MTLTGRAKKKVSTSSRVLFSTENHAAHAGLGGQLPKKEKGSLLFVMRLLLFFKAPGFSLLSLYVNPALTQALTP